MPCVVPLVSAPLAHRFVGRGETGLEAHLGYVWCEVSTQGSQNATGDIRPFAFVQLALDAPPTMEEFDEFAAFKGDPHRYCFHAVRQHIADLLTQLIESALLQCRDRHRILVEIDIKL